MGKSGKGNIIKGPIHGFIELSKLQEDLLAQPELERLAWVKQLGLVLLVYPGAHQTRLEHSLGTSHLCGEIAGHLNLGNEEKELLEAAGMLHDLGHAPFSHAVELVVPGKHLSSTRGIVTGERKMDLPGSGEIPSILEDHGLDPEEVADLITEDFRGRRYLQDVVSSQMDADQLDYLARDSHYTGVSYGAIEVDWILNVMRINQGRLTYLEKGIDALEDYLLARDHMFSSVYFHKTVSIAEKMLLRAVQRALDGPEGENLLWMTDGELLETLRNSNPYSKEMVERIKGRRLYKLTYSIKTTDSEEKLEKLKKVEDRNERELEREIAEAAGIEEKFLIVDKQKEFLDGVEPRLRKFDIKISRDDGKVVSLEQISEIARSLKKKQPIKTLFSVYTVPKYREELGQVVESYLESQ